MAPAREMTDQDLIRTYVDSQDVESLGVFFCRYKRVLMRFVSNFLQDESVAQGIVQESFFRVARKPARLLDVNSCRNGLLKIALNLSIGHLRRSVRGKNLPDPWRMALFSPQPPEITSMDRNLQPGSGMKWPGSGRDSGW